MGTFLFTVSTGEEELKKQNVSSQINNNRTVFTVQEDYKSGSLRVYYNGIRQITSVSFTETSSTTFTTTFTPQTGDYLTIDYTPNP